MALATKRNGARDIDKSKGPSMSRNAKTAVAQESVRDIDDNEETCVSRTQKITTKKIGPESRFYKKNEEFDRYHLWESL